jgi:ketosteroid isomerase-like protein
VSSLNLALIESIYAAWENGDFGSADWAHPKIEFVMHGGLGSGTWTGVAAMAEEWARMIRAWDELRAVPEEIREIDDDRVLVLLKNEGRGKGSGIDLGEISVKSANVFTVHHGKVTRLVLYWDREKAIKDLGLMKETESGGA